MSQSLPDVFRRIQERKKESRELKAMYRDALANNASYQDIKEEIESLKTKKKKIEEGIKSELKEEFDKLEGLKLNIAGDNQLLSDIAVKNLVEGENIKIVDENKVEYEPIFNVKFKKIN
jgi:predicted phage-related endonuclease